MARHDRVDPGDATAPTGASVLSGIQGWLHDGVELLRVRVELASLEAATHAREMAELVAWAVAAAVLLSLGLGFMAALVTVLLWDTHRALALAMCAVLLVTLGLVALVLVRRKWLALQHWFQGTRQELAADVEQLKP
jgi:uncharacterized membrane protein YqjE